VLELPRAARLALWGAASLRHDESPEVAATAVHGDDEPHTASGEAATAGTLEEVLRHLAAGGAHELRLALPAPGDPHGLAGPGAFTVEATDAGEAVLALTSGAPLGLVPEVTVFGSTWEPGAMVDWRVHQVNEPRPQADSLSDADRALRDALRTATEVLATLDVSRWREDAAERIVAVRDGGLAPHALPRGTDVRVARVLATALRVRAIVELALEDDGAAVTGYEATRRATALREVDVVARRSLAAAVNAATSGQVRPSTAE